MWKSLVDTFVITFTMWIKMWIDSRKDEDSCQKSIMSKNEKDGSLKKEEYLVC
jgi:hypothetical protein